MRCMENSRRPSHEEKQFTFSHTQTVTFQVLPVTLPAMTKGQSVHAKAVGLRARRGGRHVLHNLTSKSMAEKKKRKTPQPLE